MIRTLIKGNRAKLIKPTSWAIIIILLFFLPLIVNQPYYNDVFIRTLIYIIVVCSLRTIALSGQVSLAHAAFMGIGAYSSGVLAIQFGLSPWLTIPLGGLMTMIFAVIVGFAFTRLRAFYFSMVSLLGGMAIANIIIVAAKWTGSTSLTGIPPLSSIHIPGLFTIDFAGHIVPYYYFMLIVTLFCLCFLYSIEHSRIGMTWKAIAQSHPVASSVGINEARYRVLSLAVGCFFAGIAGACFAHYNLVIAPDAFGFFPSIFLVMYMLVGGLGSFYGPIIGTVIFMLTPEIFSWMKAYAPLVEGIIMVIVVFLLPGGIVSLFSGLKTKKGKIGQTEVSVK